MLFWVMTPKYSWPICLQIFYCWLVWLVNLNTRGPLLHCTCFPWANSQVHCYWIQSVVTVATWIFLWANVTVNHTTHRSALHVSAQQFLISFKIAAHCGELELRFSTNDLCKWFICANSWNLNKLWFFVLNNFESLIRVLKPNFYLRLTYVNS